MTFAKWSFITLLFLTQLACSAEEPSRDPLNNSTVLLGITDNHLINVTVNTESSPTSGTLVPRLEIEAVAAAGEGATFEAVSTTAEFNNQQLVFSWTDAFGNQGRGTLSPVGDRPGTYRLILSAEKLTEPRVARYMREYLVHQRGRSSNGNIINKGTNTPDSKASGNQG